MTKVLDQSARTAARVYLEAFDRGEPPSAAVRAHFHGDESVTRAVMRRARQLRLLPEPTSPLPEGDGPYVTGKIRKVAEVVGVDPRVLYEAILEHANGDLRIRPGRKKK